MLPFVSISTVRILFSIKAYLSKPVPILLICLVFMKHQPLYYYKTNVTNYTNPHRATFTHTTNPPPPPFDHTEQYNTMRLGLYCNEQWRKHPQLQLCIVRSLHCNCPRNNASVLCNSALYPNSKDGKQQTNAYN